MSVNISIPAPHPQSLTFPEALYFAAFLIAPARNDIRAAGLEPQLQYKGVKKDRKVRGADNQLYKDVNVTIHTHTLLCLLMEIF